MQTLVENPDATFADLAQAGKENIATALGLHAVGHVAGKAKALFTDLDAPRKARQVIDQLGAPNRQNTFKEALQLHEAEKTLAAAQKDYLEKKKSAGSTLTADESSLLDKAHATLARHAPRDRGPLPAIPDARRTIQDLSKKEASGPLNADDAHSLAHARRAIAQQRVNDLAALGTAITPQQLGQLNQFKKILAASPYGTELPKGPPPGYDPQPRGPIPGNPNPQHHEWYPPEGEKPIHPATEKFTPDALAISDDEIKATKERLKTKGHAHDRHGPEVTEGQLDDRVKHQVDPMTQTTESGAPRGKDHRSAEHATQFTSDRAMTHALKEIERHPDFTRAETIALNHLPHPSPTFAVKLPLKDVLGDKYAAHVRGRSLVDLDNPSAGTKATELTDGNVKAVYKYDRVTRKYYLLTMYPDPK